MSKDTFRVVTAGFAGTDEALQALDQVWQLWTGSKFGESYEAAVLARDGDSKVEVLRRHSEPVVGDARSGAAVGLAMGVLMAMFPAVGLGAGLIAGAGTGAGLGALSGHLTGHLSDHDLEDLGRVLERGSAGLIVAIRNPTQSIYPLLRHATSIVGKDVVGRPSS